MKEPVYQTKSDYAYSVIKSEIMSGEIAPGERLVISKLADRFSVSDIPIRDALNRLTSEGLVDVYSNNRSVVSNISLKELQDTIEMRIILEPICSKISTQFIEEETVSHLNNLIDEMDNAIKIEDYDGLSSLNRKFHMTIYSHCPNKKMVDIIEELLKISNRASKIFQIHPERCDESNLEHRQIVEAILEKDEELVFNLVQMQKREALKMYLKAIEASV